MKHRTPPPLPVRIDQVADRRVDPCLSQRFNNEAALPIAVTREVPVLGLAAAANAEVRAYRLDALGACALDAQQVAAVRMQAGTTSTSTISPGSVSAHTPGQSGVSATPSPRCTGWES